MFGENPKVGLTSSCLPPEILERLQSEDDLLALYQAPPSDTTAVHNNELHPASNEQLPPSPPATSQPFTSSQALSVQHHHNPSPLNSTPLDKRLEGIANQRKRGQGFFQCDCSKGKKQCQTNRCKCYKAKRLCNSSLSCHNKN